MESQMMIQGLQFLPWTPMGKFGRKPFVQFSKGFKKGRNEKVLTSGHLHPSGITTRRHKLVGVVVSCSYNKSVAPILESGSCQSLDEELVLKNKSQEVEPYLDGRSLYLVGMMGSGKTTVGKILSKTLGYSFCDVDILVEQDLGTSVAEIFKLYGEEFFREKESEALQKISLKHKLVVSTGGGAVVLPVNWHYMQKGISIWLDVPLEALARRIVAVGTNSRPLLHQESDDAYKETLMRLCTLMEERGEAYSNATARVSLEHIAAKTGQEDVCDISPTAIAIEALEQIGLVLKGEDNGAIAGF